MKKSGNGSPKRKRTGLRGLILGAGCILCVRAVLALWPYPELDAFRERSYGLVLQDRKGLILRVFPAADGVRREWADLAEIPAGVVRIFLRAEDRRFYFHPGVDPLSVLGSALRNLQAGRIVSGASTVTMQLARLIRAHPGSLRGKLREAGDALRLEARLSKKEILELWLNNIPFGSNIEGLPAMGRARFGRPAAALDESRAALLAMVPRRPGRYDPAVNPEGAVSAALAFSVRRGLGLGEAALRDAAAEATAPAAAPAAAPAEAPAAASAEAPAARVGTPGFSEKAPFFAPHFTEAAALSLKAAGNPPPPGPVRTTLDRDFQAYAEELLQGALGQVRDNRVTTGAVLAIENDTGLIRVYVGSASWFDEEHSGKIDGVRVINQPGSCLKPFLYALALDSGFGPQDILPDLPTIFGGHEAYIPSNFNRRFNGPVRLRVALASSLNIPAVYTIERLGVASFEDFLVSLGFDSIAASRGVHGTGLALGNGEVSLWELVRAFSVFPRGGTLVNLNYMEDPGLRGGAESRQVMSPYAAWVISDVLADRASRFTGFGPAPVLATPFSAMFKTGTANQFQHIWALGASRRFTVGVWMGNFSGETVIGSTGSSIPARIAAELLTVLEREDGGGGPAGGAPPELAVPVPICALSGMAAGPDCGGRLREWLLPDRIPPPCTWHRKSGLVYPPEYQAWLEERFRSGRAGNGPGEKSAARIRIPVSGSVFYLDPALPPEAQALRLETAGFGPEAPVYIDHILQGVLNPAGVYVLPLFRGRHRVTVEDDTGALAWADFEVR
ncbi:MAG: transglycosylase domain-containing protein [Spirochaetaceae bacterium]|jgi:penicillin-binding protein 1C|nr:transglycosylase domain-containing protein [Spirochaetaceae bacterium]